MSVRQFQMVRDINGYNSFGIPFSDKKYSTKLSAGIEKSLTIPPTQDSTYKSIIAIFSFTPGTTVWVSNNGKAEVPGNSFLETTSECNPSARVVNYGDILNFITDNETAEVGVSLYSVYKTES